jgi:hypothetical protein
VIFPKSLSTGRRKALRRQLVCVRGIDISSRLATSRAGVLILRVVAFSPNSARIGKVLTNWSTTSPFGKRPGCEGQSCRGSELRCRCLRSSASGRGQGADLALGRQAPAIGNGHHDICIHWVQLCLKTFRGMAGSPWCLRRMTRSSPKVAQKARIASVETTVTSFQRLLRLRRRMRNLFAV